MARRADWLVSLAVLLVLFLAVPGYELWAARGIALAFGVSSLNSFIEWQPGPQRAVVRERDGDRYLIVFGPLTGLLPSGPPAYVFDSSGALVDWARDSGDNGEFESDWHPYGSSFQLVGGDDVQAWMRGELEVDERSVHVLER